MRNIIIVLSIFVFSDLFSQTDLVRVKTYNKDSIFSGFRYLKLDTTICSSTFDTLQNREVFWYVNKMPMFGDSIPDIIKYVQRNLKYPNIQTDVMGTVFVRFIVESDGKLTNIKVLKGIDPLFDNEAIEVIENMPKWVAGECYGMEVPVYYTVPVRFVIY